MKQKSAGISRPYAEQIVTYGLGLAAIAWLGGELTHQGVRFWGPATVAGLFIAAFSALVLLTSNNAMERVRGCFVLLSALLCGVVLLVYRDPTVIPFHLRAFWGVTGGFCIGIWGLVSATMCLESCGKR